MAQAHQTQQRRDARSQWPVDNLADEALQRRRELGRQLEQQPHNCQEHRYAGPRVEQDGVDLVGEGPAQLPTGGGVGLDVSARCQPVVDLVDDLFDPREQRLGMGEILRNIGGSVGADNGIGDAAVGDGRRRPTAA